MVDAFGFKSIAYEEGREAHLSGSDLIVGSGGDDKPEHTNQGCLNDEILGEGDPVGFKFLDGIIQENDEKQDENANESKLSHLTKLM